MRIWGKVSVDKPMFCIFASLIGNIVGGVLGKVILPGVAIIISFAVTLVIVFSFLARNLQSFIL